MKDFDVYTFDDDKHYVLMESVLYNGETYCFFVEIDEKDEPQDHSMILKQIPVNDGFEFEDVEEESILLEVANLMKEKMENESNE